MSGARDKNYDQEIFSRSPLVGEHVRVSRERWGVNGRASLRPPSLSLPHKGGGERARRSCAQSRFSVCVMAALLACSAPSIADAEADHAAIAEAALTNVIRPGYADLTAATAALEGDVRSLCAQPSTRALKKTKDSFEKTVAAWSRVEILRFGPILQDHRYERIFYWPDPKGIGLRQVQTALRDRDATVTGPNSLAEKSVALQGLPALEYLLYGAGAEALATADGAFRCGFAASVADNMMRIASGTAEGWREGADHAKAFLGSVPENRLYHTPKEVTLELFKAFTAGIELVRDQKIAKPLGASPQEARPRLAPLWRSGLSFESMAGNIAGVRKLFADGGLAVLVAGESPGVEQSVEFDLDHAVEVLRGIEVPVQTAATDAELRGQLGALRVALKSASQTAGDMISRAAGLSFGFNAMDGD